MNIIWKIGIEALPDYFFGMIFSFDDSNILSQFLFYICGYFDISSKLDFFFSTLLSAELDDLLIYMALSYGSDKLKLLLEAWMIRLNNPQLSDTYKRSRVQFILSFLNDCLFDKKYTRIIETARTIKLLNAERFSILRGTVDSEIQRFLILWLFTSENFLRLLKLGEKETISFYFKLLSKFHVAGDLNMILQNRFERITSFLSNSNIHSVGNQRIQINSNPKEEGVFKQVDPFINQFCLSLVHSNDISAQMFLLLLIDEFRLTVLQSKISM